MLQYVFFERYRSFLERAEIELAPITLLFGYNNAGKSALLRGLKLLSDSCSFAAEQPLALDSASVRGASFEDIRCKYTASRDIKFGLTWSEEPEGVFSAQIRVRNEPEPSVPVRQRLSEIRVFEADVETVVLDEPGTDKRFNVRHSTHGEWTGDISFLGICPIVPATAPASLDGLRALDTRLSNLYSSVFWLSSVRAPIPRNYALKSTTRSDWAEDGSSALEWLIRHESVRNKVSEWIFGIFGQRLQLRPEGKEWSIRLVPGSGNLVEIALPDVGEGASQVLPVLVLAALASEGLAGANPILLLEQPELHLHPKAERALAEILCQVTKDSPNLRFLIESHSENLILFLQLALARKQLSPADVRLYWVRQLENRQSTLTQIHIDEAGRVRNWPPGLFSEDVELARELVLARRGQTA